MLLALAPSSIWKSFSRDEKKEKIRTRNMGLTALLTGKLLFETLKYIDNKSDLRTKKYQ